MPRSSGSCRKVRLSSFALGAILLLTACDGYREVITLEDRELDLFVSTTVICNDALTVELFGSDACTQLSDGELPTAMATMTAASATTEFKVEGELDRRTITVTEDDVDADQLSTGLVTSARFDLVDDTTGRVVFDTAASPWSDLRADENFDELQRQSRWPDPVFQFVAPDVVTEHNGDAIDGRVVTWNLDGLEDRLLTVTWSTQDPPRRWWWWIVGGVILIGVLFMMMTLEPQRNVPETDTSTDT